MGEDWRRVDRRQNILSPHHKILDTPLVDNNVVPCGSGHKNNSILPKTKEDRNKDKLFLGAKQGTRKTYKSDQQVTERKIGIPRITIHRENVFSIAYNDFFNLRQLLHPWLSDSVIEWMTNKQVNSGVPTNCMKRDAQRVLMFVFPFILFCKSFTKKTPRIKLFKVFQ